MLWKNTYFLPEEVSIHNSDRDCWLTIYGVVKNVTSLIEEFQNTDLVNPILREAGQDVSYWFEFDGVKPIVSMFFFLQNVYLVYRLNAIFQEHTNLYEMLYLYYLFYNN